MNIRDIIKEATVRVNITPRKQAVRGDIEETAFNLLKGIVSKYNNDCLLVWTQKSIIAPKSVVLHIYDEIDTVKGKNNLYFDTFADLNNSYELTMEDVENKVWAMTKDKPDSVFIATTPHPDVVYWNEVPRDYNLQRIQEMTNYINMTHMQVRDMAKINSIYVVTPSNQPYKEYYELEFINHTQYDKYSNTSRVFTYTQKAEGEWVIEMKPYFLQGNFRVKINYNESINFDDDIDTDLFIPDNYTELLIVALAHKLALMYPRLDEAQMARLEKEVQVLVDNVRTPRSEDRVLKRNSYYEGYGNMTQAELLSGRFIYG